VRKQIEAKGTQRGFVHLSGDDRRAQEFFAKYALSHLPRLADPKVDTSKSLGWSVATGALS